MSGGDMSTWQISIRNVHQETVPVSKLGRKHLVCFLRETAVADMITKVKFYRNVQFRSSNEF